jgi:hypothetical protein
MGEVTCQPGIETSQSVDPALCLAPASVNNFREATIRKVANGFIVKVGCQTFVSKTWSEVSDGLAEYWIDPVAAEKKFCATSN